MKQKIFIFPGVVSTFSFVSLFFPSFLKEKNPTRDQAKKEKKQKQNPALNWGLLQIILCHEILEM